MIRKPNTINDGYTREMILAEPDLITRRFLIAINFYLSRRLLKSEYPAPAAPFDVKFFIQVMHDFFECHNDIRDLIDGKEINSFEPDP